MKVRIRQCIVDKKKLDENIKERAQSCHSAKTEHDIA
jgi:hypothetical protein